MKLKIIFFLCVFFIISPSFAEDMMYCSENQAYIKLGMTEQQVISACGQPLSKHKGAGQVTRRVPVKQLIYTWLNSNIANQGGGIKNIYTTYSLPQAPTSLTLHVDIMNGKISNIRTSGTSPNQMTLCDASSFKIGDDASAVTQACGEPSSVNETFVNQPIPSSEKPEIWVYKPGQYQQPFSLTIVNGKLESIHQ